MLFYFHLSIRLYIVQFCLHTRLVHKPINFDLFHALFCYHELCNYKILSKSVCLITLHEQMLVMFYNGRRSRWYLISRPSQPNQFQVEDKNFVSSCNWLTLWKRIFYRLVFGLFKRFDVVHFLLHFFLFVALSIVITIELSVELSISKISGDCYDILEDA